MQERFHYKGFDAAGSRISGTVDSAGVAEARAELRDRGVLVSEINSAESSQDWR